MVARSLGFLHVYTSLRDSMNILVGELSSLAEKYPELARPEILDSLHALCTQVEQDAFEKERERILSAAQRIREEAANFDNLDGVYIADRMIDLLTPTSPKS